MLSPSPVASAAQLALSPDGQQLAFIAAAKGGASQIWTREHPVASAPGHGRRVVPVLVPRQSFPRVFCRGQAQEDRYQGRRTADHFRCGCRTRRNLES
jgi:hypothetical protein